MKYVINKNLAGTDLRMDDAVYAGSPEGVFEVSDEHAAELLATRGWSESVEPPKKAVEEDPRTALQQAVRAMTAPPAPAPAPPAPPAPPPAPEPPAAPEPAPEPPAPPAPPPAPEPEPEEEYEPEDEEEEGEAEEGPDLAAMDKNGLLAVAKQYEVKVPSRISEENLRKLLDKELYGEGDNTNEE